MIPEAVFVPFAGALLICEKAPLGSIFCDHVLSINFVVVFNLRVFVSISGDVQNRRIWRRDDRKRPTFSGPRLVEIKHVTGATGRRGNVALLSIYFLLEIPFVICSQWVRLGCGPW